MTDENSTVKQLSLPGVEPKAMTRGEIRAHWVGMPEYNNVTQKDPEIIATFKFRTEADFLEFQQLLKEQVYKTNGKIFDGMQSKTEKRTWYPLTEKASNYEFR